MFPSLVNCTTIDWFSEWPLEALTSVARSFCADLDLGQRSSSSSSSVGVEHGSLIDGVLAACVHIHQSVEAKSKQYYQELRRWARPAAAAAAMLAELPWKDLMG
jgi:dynein heavy chain